MNKTWTLTPSHTLTLAPPNKRGICHRCQLEKIIWLLSERQINAWGWEERKFCWSCALTDVYELEESDYPVESKKQIIKELREALTTNSESQLLECYE